MLDALDQAGKLLAWKPESSKILFLIADAPPHGR